jgi:Fic family protein
MRLPRKPPNFEELFREACSDLDRFEELIAAGANSLQSGSYKHWDNLVYLDPPGKLTQKEWWLGIKMSRRALYKRLPFTDAEGNPFAIGMPDAVLEMTHRIDRDASGKIEISDQVINPNTRERYLVNSLIQEAITSSQLEGAATTHRVAKEMLRSGRDPKDRSERMIVNNYRAMQFIRQYRKYKLTPQMVYDLHEVVTNGTLDDPSAAGRLRRADESIQVWDPKDQTLLHTPPPADGLAERIGRLCEFANGSSLGFFVHPVVRAIVLHFWLGYDHPFVDGNGRTARALFYWAMLSQGYWLCEYLSISTILKSAPAKYARAYLYTESDDNDVTYFLLYNLRVILRSIKGLHEYLQEKMREFRETSELLRQSDQYNHRQIALLSHALRHPNEVYTIPSHRESHRVVNQTARTDLLKLAERGLLSVRRKGRAFYFTPPADLAELLQAQRRPARKKAASDAKRKRGKKAGK